MSLPHDPSNPPPYNAGPVKNNSSATGLFNRFKRSSLLAPPVERAVDDEAIRQDPRPAIGQSSKTKWERRIPVIACGAGLFSDGYNNAAIGPAGYLLKTIYKDTYTSSRAVTVLSAITFAGEVFGIFLFGYTSDHWSRKWSLFISTIILLIFAILSSGAYGAGGDTLQLFNALVAYRFLLGIGIGGEYPAGSVGCAESTGELESGKRNRWFIWFTNLQIDLGFVAAYIVATVVVLATGESHLRAAWRIILGIGAIPPLSLIWMRYKLEEPEAFQREKMSGKDTKVPWLLIVRLYWFRMLVVSAIWFIYDFSAFAFGLYSSDIVGSLLGDDKAIWKNFAWSILINAFYLPGAMAGSFISDWLGPRTALTLFVSAQGVVGFIMAGVYGELLKPGRVAAFCVVYGIFLSLGEMGPGDNIGLVASKTSATAVRGQYYGIAAAMGKVGAFVGTYVFKYIQDAGGPPDAVGTAKVRRGQYPFWVASSLCFLAAALALFCLPHIGQDTIDDEDRRFRAYLKEHGYDTSKLGAIEYQEGSVAHDDSSLGAEDQKTDVYAK